MSKMQLRIDRASAVPLVNQVVEAIRERIESQGIRPEERMPSIRQLAQDAGISRNTVIEAYDQLVAQGLLRSRLGSGFYVTERAPRQFGGQGSSNPELAFDVTSQMWNLFNSDNTNLKLGCGWLPEAWREIDDLSYAIRHVTRMNRAGLLDYSTPLGSMNLRQLVQKRLRLLDMQVDGSQILLTTGASHALDLLVRYLTKPGDTVFVESPGYYNLFGLLKLQGVNMVGVPRTHQGPDMDELERLLQIHRPRLFFVNSVLQNPTGTTLAPGVAHRLLQLAERFDFTVVEDDIYADFQADPTIRLAALDGLKRVIYLSSYSKSLSCSLRVGFIVGDSALIRALVDVKMLTSIASSRFAEHVVATMLENGSYRKLIERLRQKMTRQMVSALSLMQGAGWEIFSEPAGGMFVWARRPEVASAQEVIARAAARGVSLTPGAIFRQDAADTPWLRINVTYAADPRAAAFLTDWPVLPTRNGERLAMPPAPASPEPLSVPGTRERAPQRGPYNGRVAPTS